jgi:3-oxoadipate enol-lactonase
VALSSGARWTPYGTGKPTTVVVHGLGATEGEARIPASGLPGTRVVVTLPGHGQAPDAPPGYWNYPRIAEDVAAIAEESGATRAVGVSLGAGALMRIAAAEPDRFERLALLLPASLERARDEFGLAQFDRLADAVDATASDGVDPLRDLVAAEVPTGADVGDYVARRTATLLRLGDALRAIPKQSAISDASPLASVASHVLVIGATEDPRHPADVAKSVAAAFSHARLELLPSPAPMLTHRQEIRRLLRDFLG